MIAVATVLVVVVLSIIITRVATVALTVTGLSGESARFQARSALTGTGFATQESELVVNHPVRRRIIMTLMLLGNAGLVTMIGALVVGFVGAADRDQALVRIAMLLAGLVAVLLLARNDRVDRFLTRSVARILREYTDLDVRDYARLLHLAGPWSVHEMAVREGHWLAGRTLAEVEVTEEGIVILGIQRPDGNYIGAPRGDAPIAAGDTLICYGRGEALDGLEGRPSGPEGDAAHRRAVEDHRVVRNAERYRDPARGS